MTTRLELLPDVYLTAVQTSRFKTACFSLSFLRPLRQEEAGMNALLPSVLLRGSESAPSIRAIADRLDALCGASVGSLVRKKGEIQLTGLFADGLEDRYAGEPVFSRLLELTAELLLRPRTQGGVCVPQIVMQERQKQLDTIESTLDDKAEYCQTQLLRQMCRGEAYAVGRLGEADSLAAVDEAALWAHYQKVLASSRAELFYLGSKPAQEVAALLRPLLKALPRSACVPVSTAPGPQPKALRRTRERLPLAQGRIALGFRTGITLHDGRYPAMLLCNAILGGGEQNRLYTVIRGEQSLCYEAGSWYDGHKGILCAEAGCDFADLPAVEAAILQQVGALAAQACVGVLVALGRGRRAAVAGVLRAAAGTGAHAQVDASWVHVQDARGDGQHVHEAPAGKLAVNALGGGVLADLQPAAAALQALVELDGHGVVGQIGVVDAVAADVLAAGPLGAQLGHLGQAAGKLVARGHQHGDAHVAGKRDLRGDGELVGGLVEDRKSVV